MANKKLPELTKAELDVLRVLWKRGQSTVREVHDGLEQQTQWVYNTTKTVMDRMVKKGILSKETFHGIFIYKHLINRPAGLARFVQFFAEKILEIEPKSVVALFAHNKTLSEDEINQLEKILDEAGIEMDEEEESPSPPRQKKTSTPKTEAPKAGSSKAEDPGKLTSVSVDQLKSMMEAAIAEEDYEKAAKIRDELNRRKS